MCRLVLVLLTVCALALSPVLASQKPDPMDRETQHARGRVTQVRPDDKEIVIKTRSGETLKLRLGENSKVLLNNHAATLGEFKERMPVHVTYRAEGKDNQVVSLEARKLDVRALGQTVKTVLERMKSQAGGNSGDFLSEAEQALAHAEDLV